jgi:F0F1-type ATP synthase membrane subunit b/b'
MHTCHTNYIYGSFFLVLSIAIIPLTLNFVPFIGVVLYLLSPNPYTKKAVEEKEDEISKELNFSVHSISL